MPPSRRQALRVLGGAGVGVAAGGIGVAQLPSDVAAAEAQLEIQDVEAEAEDGTIEDVLLTDGRGELAWENIDPTFIQIWLRAEPVEYDGSWGWDPQITEDKIPDGDRLAFTFDDLFTTSLSLSDSVGGQIDISIFEPNEDEDERTVTLRFTFQAAVLSDGSDVARTTVEDTATITVRRAENGEPTASLTDVTFELTVET